MYMDPNLSFSIKVDVQVSIGDQCKTISSETNCVDLTGLSLSSVNDAKHAASLIESSLLEVRDNVFHKVLQIILNLLSLLLGAANGVPGDTRSVKLESIFGSVRLPVHDIPLEKLGLRKTLHTAGVSGILANSVISQSIRNTTDDFNRQQHRKDDDKLKPRSVCNTIVEMGTTAFSAMRDAASSVLESCVDWTEKGNCRCARITKEVAAAQGWGYKLSTDPEILGLHKERIERIVRAINNRTRDELIKAKMKKEGDKFDLARFEASISRRMIEATDLAFVIERPDEKVVYIMIDGILSHLQKDKRGVAAKKRRWTNNNVAYIEVDGYRHVLVAKELQELFNFIYALLIKNGLMDRRMIFFVDGATEISEAIEERFAFTKYNIFLDYYHAWNKVYELSSMWVQGSKKRKNAVRAALRAYIWIGRIDCVLSYLETFVKNKDLKISILDMTDEELEANEEIACGKKFKELYSYFTRKGKYVPCYAVRKELGLVNSSNCVEQTNNVMIATRQKNNGMSWSTEGSLAIAVLTMLKRNGTLDFYITTGEVNFNFAGVKVGGKRAKAIRDRLAAA